MGVSSHILILIIIITSLTLHAEKDMEAASRHCTHDADADEGVIEGVSHAEGASGYKSEETRTHEEHVQHVQPLAQRLGSWKEGGLRAWSGMRARWGGGGTPPPTTTTTTTMTTTKGAAAADNEDKIEEEQELEDLQQPHDVKNAQEGEETSEAEVETEVEKSDDGVSGFGGLFGTKFQQWRRNFSKPMDSDAVQSAKTTNACETGEAHEEMAGGPEDPEEREHAEQGSGVAYAQTPMAPSAMEDVAKPKLIWSALCDADACLEREFRSRVMHLCSPNHAFDSTACGDVDDVEAEQMQAVVRRFVSPDARELPLRELPEYLPMGGDMLLLDERLKYVRFKVVPRHLSEEKFWQRYFGAVHEEMRTARMEEAIRTSEAFTEMERKMTARIPVREDNDDDGSGGDNAINAEKCKDEAHGEATTCGDVDAVGSGGTTRDDTEHAVAKKVEEEEVYPDETTAEDNTGDIESAKADEDELKADELISDAPVQGTENADVVEDTDRPDVVVEQKSDNDATVHEAETPADAHAAAAPPPISTTSTTTPEADNTTSAAVAALDIASTEADTSGFRDSSDMSPHENFEQYVVGLDYLSETGLITLEEALGAGRAVRSMRDFGKLDGVFGTDWRSTAVGGGATRSTASGRVVSRAMQAGRKFVNRFSSNGDEATIIRVLQAVYHLFDTRAYSNPMGCGASSQDSIAYYIGGAPPDGFVVWLATHMALCSSPREMALLWVRITDELRWMWKHKRCIPRMPKEEFPDVRCCLLHQQLMLLNGCIARCQTEETKETVRSTLRKKEAKKKRDAAAAAAAAASDAVNATPGISSPPGDQHDGVQAEEEKKSMSDFRRGAIRRLPGLVGESGLDIWEPETQRQALLTETQMRETQEMQMKHAATGHGAAALLSDIQAFKAANPSCTFIDFVRWYSPADYNSRTCTLSKRMEDENSMWRELFAQARPVPIVDQTPIFDAELAGEEALQTIIACPPSDLMEQLLTVYISQIHCSASISEFASDEPLVTALQESGQLFEDLSGRGMSENRVSRFCSVALQLLRISNTMGVSGGEDTEADGEWVAV